MQSTVQKPEFLQGIAEQTWREQSDSSTERTSRGSRPMKNKQRRNN